MRMRMHMHIHEPKQAGQATSKFYYKAVNHGACGAEYIMQHFLVHAARLAITDLPLLEAHGVTKCNSKQPESTPCMHSEAQQSGA